jgi:hypothetical protein
MVSGSNMVKFRELVDAWFFGLACCYLGLLLRYYW